MSNFTLVTGLWDIKRGELENFHRSFDHYLETFDSLLSLDFNMCIYIPQSLRTFVNSRRPSNNTNIIIRELDDLRVNFPFYKEVQAIRSDPSWLARADWLANSPQAKLEFYNPIVMSKFFMLHDCAIMNPYNSDYLFWIDGGLTNTVSKGYLENLPKVIPYMKSVKKDLLFLSFPYNSNSEVHGFEYKRFAEFCGVEKTEYVCRGGFFGGHKNAIREFNPKYYDSLRETLTEGYMGTEENIHTMLSYLYPEKIHRFELEDNGLVYRFFDHLANTIKNSAAIKNDELIPWNKKKDIMDIKTSLYVLTYNSPDQFEKLIESYLAVDSTFIRQTRKILIDNSTDFETYDKYQELCKKYGFEHIKKEDNVGICGGRQFVAEHFNESDSEYYIFLEDDMNLNVDNSVCSCGFNTQIEDLYEKSLTIIHNNRYDYLKLSFSEFYGDNKTQWAWYNVPQNIRELWFPDKTKLPESGLDPDAPKTEVTQEKRYKDLKYFEGEFHYCNWPLWFSRKGNRKVFLDTKWAYPNEQTWMSHVFQLQKAGKIKAAALALSPIFHHRFDYYPAEERKES